MVFGGVSSAMGGSTPAGWGEQGFGKMVTGGSEVAEGASKVGAAGNEGLIGGGGSETVGGGAAGDTLNASAVTEAPINGAIGPEATPGLNADLSGLQPSQATGSAAGPWTNPQTANPGFVGHSVNATPSVMGAPMPAGATGAYVPDGSSGGLFGNGGWIERNGDLAGKVGGGIAQGAMGMLKGDGADYTDVYNRRLDQDQNQWLAGRQAHDQASGGLLTARPATTRPDGYYPTPNQRFASNQYGAGQWVYDSQQGRVVFVANAAPATATA
jgi:hypothetical protein